MKTKIRKPNIRKLRRFLARVPLPELMIEVCKRYPKYDGAIDLPFFEINDECIGVVRILLEDNTCPI
jgi:hypothetical protein